MKLYTLNIDNSALFLQKDDKIINLFNNTIFPESSEHGLIPVKASEKVLVINKFCNNIEAKINADKTRMIYTGGEARERLRRTIARHSEVLETLRALL